MAVDPKTLSTISLFSDMDETAIEMISHLMSRMETQEGEVLTQKGEPAQSFYIILSGNYMISFDEDRAITLHDSGQIIGWSSVVSPFKYTGTAVSLTKGEVLSMSSLDFRRLLQENSRISELLMMKISAIVSDRMPYVTGTKTISGF